MASMGRRSLHRKAVRASQALATDYRYLSRSTRRAIKQQRGRGLRRQALVEIAERT